MVGQSNARILIVEDDVICRNTLKLMLEDHGIAADGCGTLAEAFAILDKKAPFAIMLDLSLPDGCGIELLAAIRKQQLPVHVAIVTGTSDKKILDQLDQAKPDKIFRKPFGVQDLADWIRSLRPSQHDEVANFNSSVL